MTQEIDYRGNDFYCDVALKNVIKLKKEYESDKVLAFHHTRPFWPVHIVVVPKKHISSFTTITEEDRSILLEMISVLKDIGQKVEKKHGAARIVTNLGKYQDSKHLHFHLSSGSSIHMRPSLKDTIL